jgi:NAD(P)-dependent dehydrogenase (short-subunit alcohol dehydrogenase family)
LQVNYLSTALLSILLLPILKSKSPVGVPGRLTIISTSSTLTTAFANHAADPLFPALDKATPAKWSFDLSRENYGISKVLGLCLLQKLSELVAPRDVVVDAVDPGFVRGTGLHRDAEGMGEVFMNQIKWLTARSMLHAAWTYVDAAFVKGADAHGGFFVNWELHP